MKIWACVALTLLTCGCGGMQLPFPDEVEALAVSSISPADGAEIEPGRRISLEFSAPVDERSVDEETLLVYPLIDDAKLLSVIKDAEDEDITGIAGGYFFSEDKRSVEFAPEGGFGPGNYLVIATTNIVGENLIPLNQKSAASPGPFYSKFSVTAESAYTISERDEYSPTDSGNSSGPSSADKPSEGGSSSSLNEGEDDNAAGDDYSGAAPEPVDQGPKRPSFAVINELLYDVVGSDTNGQVFIEIFSESACDLSSYKLLFVGGDTGVIYDTLTLKSGSVVGTNGLFIVADAITGDSANTQVEKFDAIANFDPQNGPDCIVLVDENGNWLDSLGYGSPLIETAQGGYMCFEATSAPKVSSGHSLSRVFGLDTNDNSSDFVDLENPTPGEL